MAFEQFPQHERTSMETNVKGVQNCRQILGCQDAAVRAFNQLAQDAKRSVCLLGKVTKADLASPMLLGDRWEHYSKAGQIKLVQGMIELHNAINAIPTKAMLVEYKKVLWRSE